MEVQALTLVGTPNPPTVLLYCSSLHCRRDGTWTSIHGFYRLKFEVDFIRSYGWYLANVLCWTLLLVMGSYAFVCKAMGSQQLVNFPV